MSVHIDLSLDVAMITAGGGRIGGSVATLLARAGAKVVMVDGSGAAAKAVAEQITAEGGTAIAIPADLADQTAVSQALTSVRDRLGSVSILVNNMTSDTEGLAGQRINPVAEPTLTDTINLTRAAMTDLRANQGRIVNIISDSAVAGRLATNAQLDLTADVIALTRSLAHQVGGEGVRVNLVAAGALITPENSSVTARHRTTNIFARTHPLGRLGTAADIAGAVLFLASPLAQWITGQVLPVNGGYDGALPGQLAERNSAATVISKRWPGALDK
jgi:NAD(P)-dependent dehydrogenase (short-subunit alcohol dehydrogenase family)